MKTSKIMHWLPRVLCIAAIFFISLFALDAFDSDETVGQQTVDFLKHMTPSFVLLLLLIVAWNREFAGGVIFTLIGIVFTPLIFMHNYKMNHSVWMSMLIILMVTVPFILVGILFIVSHFMKKRDSSEGDEKVNP